MDLTLEFNDQYNRRLKPRTPTTERQWVRDQIKSQDGRIVAIEHDRRSDLTTQENLRSELIGYLKPLAEDVVAIKTEVKQNGILIAILTMVLLVGSFLLALNILLTRNLPLLPPIRPAPLMMPE